MCEAVARALTSMNMADVTNRSQVNTDLLQQEDEALSMGFRICRLHPPQRVKTTPLSTGVLGMTLN